LNTFITQEVRIERSTGMISIVSIGLLYDCACEKSIFKGSSLDRSASTIVYGEDPIVLTFLIKDSASTILGNLDGTTHCDFMTPTSLSLRDTTTDVEI
jgi:hypothetical protein